MTIERIKTAVDIVEKVQDIVYKLIDRNEKRRKERDDRDRELRELREKVARLEGDK